MEAETRQSRERFELIARATPDLILDWDIQADPVWCNEALETVFGYAREDTRPEPEFWERCLHPEDRVRVQADLTTVLNGSGTHWKNEYRFRRADDSYAAVVDRGYILRDAEGRPIRMLGSLVDLTERQELELRLNRSRRLEAIR